MKNTIRILSVGSMVLYALTFLLLILAITLQSALVPVLFDIPDHVFALPISPVLSGFWMLVLSVITVILSFREKTSLWVTILLIVLPIFVLTPLTSAASYYQSRLVNEVLWARSLSVMSSLISYVTCLNPIAYGAYLVCCGMRIACHWCGTDRKGQA